MEAYANTILKKRKNGLFHMFSLGFSKGSRISFFVNGKISHEIQRKLSFDKISSPGTFCAATAASAMLF